ncbi:MAG: hypothetical protein ACE5G8_01815 [Anaerolineae bacterium]
MTIVSSTKRKAARTSLRGRLCVFCGEGRPRPGYFSCATIARAKRANINIPISIPKHNRKTGMLPSSGEWRNFNFSIPSFKAGFMTGKSRDFNKILTSHPVYDTGGAVLGGLGD